MRCSSVLCFGLLLFTACPDDTQIGAGKDTSGGGRDGSTAAGDSSTTPEDGATTTSDRTGNPYDSDMVDPDGSPVLATCDDTAEGLSGCQCSDGIDQPCDGHPAGNGLVDEYDLYCTGPFDDDECSFATGIPGDNRSHAHGDRECFFDGDSGLGNDDDCYRFVPPGCDCYGCCEFDVNSDGVKENVRLAEGCEVFTEDPAASFGELGGGCLPNDQCGPGLYCITDQFGDRFCGPCEPCANFGGTECDDATGDGCCWNECDEASGQICYGDPPPEPSDGGTPGGSDAATGNDLGGAGADGSSTGADGSSSGLDGSSGTQDSGGSPLCDGLRYCGADGPCDTGFICYYACCIPLEG